MSQNITLLGASYSAVPAVTLPKTGGGTASFTDVTDTTAAAGDVASGKYFYTAAGVRTQGTSSGGGSGKNAQIATGAGRATSSTYTQVGPTLTVSKAGTYDVYWTGYRSSTSGTNGSQLYKNGTAYGTAQTSFNTGSGLTNTQQVHLSNVSLAANDVLTIRARSRGNNYYMYVMDLTIIEA